jgi:hypothetical protein
MNEFTRLEEAITRLESRLDNLAAFFGSRIKDLAEEVRYLKGILEGTHPAQVGGLDLEAEARESGVRLER